MLFFLSDTDESELDYRLQDLENADSESQACMVVNVWQPFENVTVSQLFKHIEDLEEEFDKCQEPLNDDCIKAKNMLRDLRDSDLHKCPADEDDTEECSCEAFDRIIDVLSD